MSFIITFINYIFYLSFLIIYIIIPEITTLLTIYLILILFYLNILKFLEPIKIENKRQTGDQFYNFLKCSCLGVVLVTKNEKGERVDNKVSFLSEFLQQSKLMVNVALAKLISSEFFKNLGIKQLYIWSDKGSHFHNFSYLGFFGELVFENFVNLEKEEIEKLEKKKDFISAIDQTEHKIEKVTINFFVEYHGKFIADSFFNFLQIVIDSLKEKEIEISTVSELVRNIIENINERKERNELEKIEKNFGKEFFDKKEKKIEYHILEICEEDILKFSKQKQQEYKKNIKNINSDQFIIEIENNIQQNTSSPLNSNNNISSHLFTNIPSNQSNNPYIVDNYTNLGKHFSNIMNQPCYQDFIQGNNIKNLENIPQYLPNNFEIDTPQSLTIRSESSYEELNSNIHESLEYSTEKEEKDEESILSSEISEDNSSKYPKQKRVMIEVNKKDLLTEFVLPILKLKPGQLDLFSSFIIEKSVKDDQPFSLKVKSSFPCEEYINISDYQFSREVPKYNIYKRTTLKQQKSTKLIQPLYYNKKMRVMFASQNYLKDNKNIKKTMQEKGILEIPKEFLKGENLSPNKPKNNLSTTLFLDSSKKLIEQVNDIIQKSKLFLMNFFKVLLLLDQPKDINLEKKENFFGEIFCFKKFEFIFNFLKKNKNYNDFVLLEANDNLGQHISDSDNKNFIILDLSNDWEFFWYNKDSSYLEIWNKTGIFEDKYLLLFHNIEITINQFHKFRQDDKFFLQSVICYFFKILNDKGTVLYEPNNRHLNMFVEGLEKLINQEKNENKLDNSTNKNSEKNKQKRKCSENSLSNKRNKTQTNDNLIGKTDREQIKKGNNSSLNSNKRKLDLTVEDILNDNNKKIKKTKKTEMNNPIAIKNKRKYINRKKGKDISNVNSEETEEPNNKKRKNIEESNELRETQPQEIMIKKTKRKNFLDDSEEY